MNKLILGLMIIFSAAGAHAQCANTGFADGCAGAPSGSPQFPHMLDTQAVTQLNIIPGSGYTNGTYTWTTSGGGGTGATGTITVSGGKLGSSTSQSYTISNEGSGYTSRPTIAIPAGAGSGSGGSITPTVYAARPAWNVPGVDYYVGIPTGTVLKDPTGGGNLPSGATLSGSTVNVTGCNVTLNGLDFTLHNNVVVVNVSGSGCVTTIENSNFQANSTALQTIANITNLGTGGSFVFTQNAYNGLASIGGTGSGFGVNDPIQGQGTITFTYNYFHNFDSKISQLSGISGNPLFTEEYNLFADFGYCSASNCSHGEAEYTYSGAPNGLKVQFSYNTYHVTFADNVADLTAPHAIQADDVNITGTSEDHNVVLAPGPGGTCSSSNNSYTAAGAIYNGDQEGGTLSGTTFSNDYVDNSGTFFPWYNDYTSGHTVLPVGPNNVDAGSASGCGNTTSPTFPTVPTGFHTTSIGSSSVALAWSAATAGSNSIGGYHIYRNGTLLASTTGTGTLTFTDSSASPSTAYSYTVATYDTSANIGAQSGFINLTTGGGSAPAVTFSPTSLLFAGTQIGTTGQQVVTLTNTGTATLTISSITVTGSTTFTQSNTCGSTVTMGSNCSITVTFAPIATGTVTGTLSVADNAAGSPQTVGLTGTGTNVAPTQPVLVGTLPTGTVGTAYSAGLTASGGSPPYTWSVTPNPPSPGLSMAATSGLIAGTPTTASSTPLSFVVKDSTGASSSPYATTLTINASSKATITMSANPTSLTFTGTVGGANPACQSWVGDDNGVGPLPVSLTVPSWIKPVAAGNTKFSVSICPVIAGLPAGTTTGSMSFVNTAPNPSGNTAKNTPLAVPVTITLTGAPPPAMSINCTTASAGVTNLPSGAFSMTVTSGKTTASCTGTH